MISGSADYEDMEEFGRARRKWLETFLDLPHGIPDEATFKCLFTRLNPSEVAECLYGWLGSRDCEGKLVSYATQISAKNQHQAQNVHCRA